MSSKLTHCFIKSKSVLKIIQNLLSKFALFNYQLLMPELIDPDWIRFQYRY
jgi:hypothetical protein